MAERLGFVVKPWEHPQDESKGTQEGLVGPTRSFRLRRNPAKDGGQACSLECSCLAQEFGAPESVMFGHLGDVKTERLGFEPRRALWALHALQACSLDQLGHLSVKGSH